MSAWREGRRLPFSSLSVPSKGGPASALCQSPTTHTHLPGLGRPRPAILQQNHLALALHTLRAPVLWSPWAQWGSGGGGPEPDSVSPRGVPSSTHCLTQSGPPQSCSGGGRSQKSHILLTQQPEGRGWHGHWLSGNGSSSCQRGGVTVPQCSLLGPQGPSPESERAGPHLVHRAVLWGRGGRRTRPHGFAHISRTWTPDGSRCNGPKALINFQCLSFLIWKIGL